MAGSAARQHHIARLAAWALALAVGANLPRASPAAEATVLVSATVVAPLALAAPQPALRFGAFSSTAGGQVVTVRPDGTRVLGGAAQPEVAQAQPFGPAHLVIRGERGMRFSIVLPARADLATGHAGPGQTLQVSGFASEPAGGGVLQDGSSLLRIGATLTTSPGQALGAYYGSFGVTVAYD